MGELDDLAAAATERQQAAVRRRQPATPPALIVQPHFHAAPKPRSAFLAGYAGTFGVLAALLTIVGIFIVIGMAMWPPGKDLPSATSRQDHTNRGDAGRTDWRLDPRVTPPSR